MKIKVVNFNWNYMVTLNWNQVVNMTGVCTYQQIPQILSFVDEQGEDRMKQEIESNYKQIKMDIVQIIEMELERIKNDPDLQHLVQE